MSQQDYSLPVTQYGNVDCTDSSLPLGWFLFNDYFAGNSFKKPEVTKSFLMGFNQNNYTGSYVPVIKNGSHFDYIDHVAQTQRKELNCISRSGSTALRREKNFLQANRETMRHWLKHYCHEELKSILLSHRETLLFGYEWLAYIRWSCALNEPLTAKKLDQLPTDIYRNLEFIFDKNESMQVHELLASTHLNSLCKMPPATQTSLIKSNDLSIDLSALIHNQDKLSLSASKSVLKLALASQEHKIRVLNAIDFILRSGTKKQCQRALNQAKKRVSFYSEDDVQLLLQLVERVESVKLNRYDEQACIGQLCLNNDLTLLLKAKSPKALTKALIDTNHMVEVAALSKYRQNIETVISIASLANFNPIKNKVSRQQYLSMLNDYNTRLNTIVIERVKRIPHEFTVQFIAWLKAHGADPITFMNENSAHLDDTIRMHCALLTDERNCVLISKHFKRQPIDHWTDLKWHDYLMRREASDQRLGLKEADKIEFTSTLGLKDQYSFKGYSVIPVKTPQSLKQLGRKLRLCVGNAHYVSCAKTHSIFYHVIPTNTGDDKKLAHGYVYQTNPFKCSVLQSKGFANSSVKNAEADRVVKVVMQTAKKG